MTKRIFLIFLGVTIASFVYPQTNNGIELEIRTNVPAPLPSSGRKFAVSPAPGTDYESRSFRDTGSPPFLYPSSAVEVKTAGTAGQVTTVALDGANSAHTRIAIDGIVPVFAQIDSFDATLLPYEFAERVEIYRNNLRPQGIPSTAGLVNFTTPDPGSLYGEGKNRLRIYGGSYFQLGGLALTSGNRKGNKYTLGASLSFASNNYTAPTSDGSSRPVLNLDYQKYGLIARWSRDSVETGVYHSGKFAGTGSYYAGKGRQEDYLTLFSFRAAERWTVEYTHWMNRYINSFTLTDSIHHNHGVHARWNSQWTWGKMTNHIAVDSYTAGVISSSLGTQFDQEGQATLSLNYPLGKSRIGLVLSPHAGIRSGIVLLPEANLSLFLTPSLRWESTASRVYRAPTFNDLYWPADAFSRGNPLLEPENGYRIKTGLLLFLPPFIVTASANLNEIQKMIFWTPDGAGIWSPQNISSARSYGTHIRLEHQVLTGKILWESHASLSYNRTFHSDPASRYYGKQLLYQPEWKAVFSIGAKYLREAEIRADCRYVGRRYVTEMNTVSLPPYLLVDLYLRYRFVFLSLNNLLDWRYEETQGYPVMGFNITGGLDWKF